jgi:hypothetical protein
MRKQDPLADGSDDIGYVEETNLLNVKSSAKTKQAVVAAVVEACNTGFTAGTASTCTDTAPVTGVTGYRNDAAWLADITTAGGSHHVLDADRADSWTALASQNFEVINAHEFGVDATKGYDQRAEAAAFAATESCTIVPGTCSEEVAAATACALTTGAPGSCAYDPAIRYVNLPVCDLSIIYGGCGTGGSARTCEVDSAWNTHDTVETIAFIWIDNGTSTSALNLWLTVVAMMSMLVASGMMYYSSVSSQWKSKRTIGVMLTIVASFSPTRTQVASERAGRRREQHAGWLVRLALAALLAAREASAQCANSAGDAACTSYLVALGHDCATTVGGLEVGDVCAKSCGRCSGGFSAANGGPVAPGNTACWFGVAQFANCCDTDTYGNLGDTTCWSGTYTFETCCLSRDRCVGGTTTAGVDCGDFGTCTNNADGVSSSCVCDAGFSGAGCVTYTAANNANRDHPNCVSSAQQGPATVCPSSQSCSVHC